MNHLAGQTSPYLLQHAHQPVDWYPWGEAAFFKAKTENKPILLSIGYAACHWCHVMAHESFENSQIAARINQNFIAIKVDREERPDVDQIYMTALVALTGQGGWPLNIFLTPDLQPFYGGTYFPPEPRYGMPSFSDVIQGISMAWQNQNRQILASAAGLTAHLQDHFRSAVSTQKEPLTTRQILAYLPNLLQDYDWQYGGWGIAPKFPAPMTIDFLLQASLLNGGQSLQPALHALLMMSQGGIFDLVEGGFHRYSTDQSWTVPHFEKMLYDNAQLLSVYLHAYQLTKNSYFGDIAKKTLDYLCTTLSHPQGGFYSSQDADADGQEGSYYFLTADELQNGYNRLAGSPVQVDYLSEGHGEQRYVLKLVTQMPQDRNRYTTYQPYSLTTLRPMLQTFQDLRQNRIAPAIDDKLILSWNALAISALIEAGTIFPNTHYLDIARKSTDFLLDNLHKFGYLHHSWRNGQGSGIAFLEDYAGFSVALLQLYQATAIPMYFQQAQSILHAMLERFTTTGSLLADTQENQAHLITPVMELQDRVTPSGMALATKAFLLMDALQPSAGYARQAALWLSAVQDQVDQRPSAYSYWLQQALRASQPDTTCILVYPASKERDAQTIKQHYYEMYHPFRNFIAWQWDTAEAQQQAELLQDKTPQNNDLTLYFCEHHTCQQPITGRQAIIDFLSHKITVE